MEASVQRALDNTLMLLRVRLAGIQVTTTFARGLDGRQQQPDQNPDNRDHHQQLDKGESAAFSDVA